MHTATARLPMLRGCLATPQKSLSEQQQPAYGSMVSLHLYHVQASGEAAQFVPPHRTWLMVPFMHSERLEDQQVCPVSPCSFGGGPWHKQRGDTLPCMACSQRWACVEHERMHAVQPHCKADIPPVGVQWCDRAAHARSSFSVARACAGELIPVAPVWAAHHQAGEEHFQELLDECKRLPGGGEPVSAMVADNLRYIQIVLPLGDRALHAAVH